MSKSVAAGNGLAESGSVVPGSPVPFYMRQLEWLMLQETKIHQLLMP